MVPARQPTHAAASQCRTGVTDGDGELDCVDVCDSVVLRVADDERVFRGLLHATDPRTLPRLALRLTVTMEGVGVGAREEWWVRGGVGVHEAWKCAGATDSMLLWPVAAVACCVEGPGMREDGRGVVVEVKSPGCLPGNYVGPTILGVDLR